MTTTAATAVELDSAAEVLRFACEQRAVVEAGEAALLRAAVTWAEQHPVESIEQAALVPGGDHGLAIAGPGAPLVAEFCIAEFAAAIGRSTDSGRALIGAAVELMYRLPKLWARTQDGDLAAWRARRVADLTLGLCREAAAFVDAQVAPFAHRIGPAALERLVAEAVARFMPEQALADAERAAESRFFRVEHERVSFDGISRIEGALDFATRSTWRTPCRAAPHRSRQPGARSHSTYAGRWRPASWPGDSSPSTFQLPRPTPRRRVALSRARSCSSCTSPSRRSRASALTCIWHEWSTTGMW